MARSYAISRMDEPSPDDWDQALGNTGQAYVDWSPAPNISYSPPLARPNEHPYEVSMGWLISLWYSNTR